MKTSLFLLLIAVMLCFSATAQLQKEPLQEFLFAENALVQDRKEIQLTLKPAFFTKGIRNFIAPLQIEYGITDHLQAELQMPLHSLLSNSGDERRIEAGLLYGFLHNENPLSLSAGLSAGIPVRTDSKQERTIEWEPSIRIGKKFTRLDLHAVAGAEITVEERNYSFSVAGAWSLGNWRTIVEMIRHTGNDAYSSITGGLVCKQWDNFEFAAGLSRIITEDTRSWGIAFSMTYEFLVKK